MHEHGAPAAVESTHPTGRHRLAERTPPLDREVGPCTRCSQQARDDAWDPRWREAGHDPRREIVDDKTFKIVLKEPYGQVLHTLGKTGTNVPVIMREKEALIDPNTQIQEAIGSGPYKFAREQWVPGSKTVYVKNADYVPRSEPPSTFAGGSIAAL